jgi:integrase/recombinase XerD
MAAAGALPLPVLAASMRTLIGLLASTGIRSGEAFALDVSDLDTAAQVLTVTGKHSKKRLIALHPSAAAALSGYLASCCQCERMPALVSSLSLTILKSF